MIELQIFEHPRFGKIRTIMEDGKTLFCGRDAADALGYKNPSKALNDHCRWVTKREVPHPQNPEKRIEMTFITEGDLCRLAAKSEIPGAEDFESWIFDEVIPEVLRTGTYSIAPAVSSRPPQVSPSGLARLIEVHRQAVVEAGGSPRDVLSMIAELDRTWGVTAPSVLTLLEKKQSGQTSLWDRPEIEEVSA